METLLVVATPTPMPWCCQTQRRVAPRFPLRRFAAGLPLFVDVLRPAAVRALPFGFLPIPARARPVGPIWRALRSRGFLSYPAFFRLAPVPVLRSVSSVPRRAATLLRRGFARGCAVFFRVPPWPSPGPRIGPPAAATVSSSSSPTPRVVHCGSPLPPLLRSSTILRLPRGAASRRRRRK